MVPGGCAGRANSSSSVRISDYESQLARGSSLILPVPTLKTARLILRSFREEDVDAMAQLFSNPDFMRFSLGIFTDRKQTIAFIEKVMGWDRAGIPSQFAVVPRGEDAIIGYCGFFYHPEARDRRPRDRVPA